MTWCIAPPHRLTLTFLTERVAVQRLFLSASFTFSKVGKYTFVLCFLLLSFFTLSFLILSCYQYMSYPFPRCYRHYWLPIISTSPAILLRETQIGGGSMPSKRVSPDSFMTTSGLLAAVVNEIRFRYAWEFRESLVEIAVSGAVAAIL